MRDISISITSRPTLDDNIFAFDSLNQFVQDQPYALLYCELNYSVLSSNITGILRLAMSRAVSSDTVLKSGQPIVIKDNGYTVFEGILYSPKYFLGQLDEQGPNEFFVEIVLTPSIFQLTKAPMIFDFRQVAQIKQLTGVDVTSILAAQVNQSIDTDSLLQYITSNTDYSNIFGREIQNPDDSLPDSVFLMADVNEPKDSVLRSSLDYLNIVMYQEESGDIVIRQLDDKVKCPFNIDLHNTPVTLSDANQTPIVPMVQYMYSDNACDTPSVTTNYAVLDPGLSVVGQTSELILSYAGNPEFFPRLEQLQKSGWFVGQTGRTQINRNIVSDPTTQAVLNGYEAKKDQYMINVIPDNVAVNEFISSYQALETGKQMALGLMSYAEIDGIISLDDPNLPNDLSKILGTSIDIMNCELQSGIVTTYTRVYGERQSQMRMTILPLGSITGYYAS